MCLASILAKIGREETLNEDDWNDVISLAFVAAKWLYENSRVVRTPDTTQVHFQPKSSKKKRKSKTKE
jgi:hypothetical protein